MTNFADTTAGQEFIASGDSRETSNTIMEAIAFFARDIAEAEALWDGAGIGVAANLTDVWEQATGNGRTDDTDLMWGGRPLAYVMAHPPCQRWVTAPTTSTGETNMTFAEQNADNLNTIAAHGGISYTVRKYAGAWVPVVIADGKRHTFAHCSTSGGAMETAIRQAAKMAAQ